MFHIDHDCNPHSCLSLLAYSASVGPVPSAKRPTSSGLITPTGQPVFKWVSPFEPIKDGMITQAMAPHAP